MNSNLEAVVKHIDQQIFCWKCLKSGVKTPMPLYRVKNSFVFACSQHKDLPVDDDAYSLDNAVIDAGPAECVESE